MTNEHKDLLSQIQVPAELDNVLPTHQCIVCFAAWKLWADGEGHPSTKASWSLMSKSCGPCCDNVQMAGQIEELPIERRIISFANNVVPEIGNAIGTNALLSFARAVLKAGIHHAALAARPEPAGAGRPVPETDIKPMLEFTIPHVSSRGEVFVLKADVDAHVAAQVAKAKIVPEGYTLIHQDCVALAVKYEAAPQAPEQDLVAAEEDEDELTTLSNELLALKYGYRQLELKLGATEHLLATLRATIASQESLIKHLTNAVEYHKKRAK